MDAFSRRLVIIDDDRHLLEAMRFAFETLRLHRLEAAIVPRNAPSRRVAEKLALRDEGTAQRFLQIMRGDFGELTQLLVALRELCRPFLHKPLELFF